MKAVQINGYSKQIDTVVRDIPKPEPSDTEVLLRVKAAAVNPVELLSDIDHVIDTLGPAEFAHELSVLKKGGRLVSLRTGPNKAFAVQHHFTGLKKLLFTLADSKYDKAAQKQGKEYRFLFVRSDGARLQKITEIVEQQKIQPAVDSCVFFLEQANEALRLVAKGPLNGKVILQME